MDLDLKAIGGYLCAEKRARSGEISQETGIEKRKVDCLLRYGSFTHEKGCYWRLAGRSDKTE